MKLHYLFLILIGLISINLVLALDGFGYDDPNLPKLNSEEVFISFNNNTAFVNNSFYWQGYTPDSLNTLYVPYTGATANVNLGKYNLTHDKIQAADAGTPSVQSSRTEYTGSYFFIAEQEFTPSIYAGMVSNPPPIPALFITSPNGSDQIIVRNDGVYLGNILFVDHIQGRLYGQEIIGTADNLSIDSNSGDDVIISEESSEINAVFHGDQDAIEFFDPLNVSSSIGIHTSDATDPTLSFKTTNTANQMDFALDESQADDLLNIRGQTAGVDTYVQIKAQDGETAYIRLFSGSNNNGMMRFTSGDDLEIWNQAQDEDLIFKINDGGVTTEVMRIDGSSSRVGILTSTPTHELNVVGDINVSDDLFVGDDIGVGTASASYDIHVERSGEPNFALERTDVPQIWYWRVLSDGTLSYRDGTNFQNVFNIAPNSGDNQLSITDGVTALNINNLDQDIRFESVNNQNMFYINSADNRIGINTSTPSHTLNVVGDLNVTGTSYLGDLIIDADNISVNNINSKDGTIGFYNKSGYLLGDFNADNGLNIGNGEANPKINFVGTTARIQKSGGNFISASSTVTAFDRATHRFRSSDASTTFVEIDSARTDILTDANISDDLFVMDSINVGSGTGTLGGDNNLIQPTAGSAFLNLKGGTGTAKIAIANDQITLMSGTDQIFFRTGAINSTSTGIRRGFWDDNGFGIGVHLENSYDLDIRQDFPRIALNDTSGLGQLAIIMDNNAGEFRIYEESTGIDVIRFEGVDNFTAVETDTGAHPFVVSRLGTKDQGLQMWTDDLSSYIRSEQDEDAIGFGGMVFQVDDDGNSTGQFIFETKSGDNILVLNRTGQIANFRDNVATTNFIIGTVDGAGAIYSGAGDPLALANDNGNNTLLYCLTNGDCGFGTITPQTRLHVQDAGAEVLRVQRTSGSNTAIGFKNNDQEIYMGIPALSEDLFAIASDLTLGTNPYFIIEDDGHIAIGIENATHELTVWGDANISDDLFVGDSAVIGKDATTATFQVHENSGSNPELFFSDGDVNHPFTGVETETDVAGRFTIVSSTAGGLQITGFSDTSARGILMQGLIGSENPDDGMPGIDFWSAKANGSGRQDLGDLETAYQFSGSAGTTKYMTILGGGNIGINTSSPTHTLSVEGQGYIRDNVYYNVTSVLSKTATQGSLTSLNTCLDNTHYNLTETTGVNAMEANFTFDNIDSFRNIVFCHMYTGNHDLHMSIWNYDINDWIYINDIGGTDVQNCNYKSVGGNDGALINASGSVRIRIDHPQSGNTNHLEVIDCLRLER